MDLVQLTFKIPNQKGVAGTHVYRYSSAKQVRYGCFIRLENNACIADPPLHRATSLPYSCLIHYCLPLGLGR
jgi:hypothetical protein